jgi:hypothetical protein
MWFEKGFSKQEDLLDENIYDSAPGKTMFLSF